MSLPLKGAPNPPPQTPLLLSVSIGDENNGASSCAAGYRSGSEFLSSANYPQEGLRKWTHLVALKVDKVCEQIRRDCKHTVANPHTGPPHMCASTPMLVLGRGQEPTPGMLLYFITNT